MLSGSVARASSLSSLVTLFARHGRGGATVHRLQAAALATDAAPAVASTSSAIKKTCLHDFHVRHGGKMVEFGGWSMPVQYSDLGIAASHLHTRSAVSIFDVSHMLQTHLSGRDRIEFIESLTVADVGGLGENQGTLSLLTNPSGGIVDDLIINRTSQGYLYVVSNAGCADKDLAHIRSALENFTKQGKDVTLDILQNGLIAVQGPLMSCVLQPCLDIQLATLPFMTTTLATVCGVPNCRVTRCGYTGEDGVEISIPADKAEFVTQTLLSSSASVRLAGLGARDSLRLEAGLCLYGHDIDDSTTPIEAALAWTIAKRRRQQASFPGASVILGQLKDKPARKRVGFVSTGPPARGGTTILDATGLRRVGEVTSGCPSPSLKSNIAMGYVEAALAVPGSKVALEVRRTKVEAEVVKMPFVPTRYYNVK